MIHNTRVLAGGLCQINQEYTGYNDHHGMDLVGPNSTIVNIVAHSAGRVVDLRNDCTENYYNNPNLCFSIWGDTYGNYVTIRHSDNRYTFYAHLEAHSIPFSIGDPVQQGQVIGKMGNTGVSRGPHLHWEVRTTQHFPSRIDPTPYLNSNFEGQVIMPSPVPRDETKNQVEVIRGENTLKVYAGLNITNNEIGYATPGIYNIVSTIEADGYIWYQVEEGKWFANIEGCTKELLAVPLIMPLVSVQESYDNLPLGTQICFSGSNIPKSYLICDGSEVSREEYSELFSVIGTIYGEGDGSLTFNIPDKKGRVSVGFSENEIEFNEIGKSSGEKKHLLTLEELPNHSHQYTLNLLHSDGQVINAEYVNSNLAAGNCRRRYVDNTISVGSNYSHNNLQPYEVDVWIIKAKKTIDSVIVEGTVIDGFGDTSVSNASSIRNATELMERIEGAVLYNSIIGTTTDIVLNESCTKFKYIEIYFNKGGYYGYTKVYEPNGKKTNLTLITPYGNNANQMLLQSVSLNETLLTRSIYKNYINIGSSILESGTENAVMINKVVGYK